jgi:hypothetical protein
MRARVGFGGAALFAPGPDRPEVKNYDFAWRFEERLKGFAGIDLSKIWNAEFRNAESRLYQ